MTLRSAMCCIWGCTVLYMSVAVAADLTIPNTFAPGTPAVAADINSNFNATATAVNSKQNRVVGTCPPGQSISVINQDGSVTCQLGGDTSGVEFVNNTLGVALTATAATVATITVTVPAAGFLIASGYGNAECGSAGTSLTVTLQNATTAVVSPSTFDSRPTAGEFRYYAVHYVFAVTAGVNTINLRASCGTGTGLMNINTLNAIFVPNRY